MKHKGIVLVIILALALLCASLVFGKDIKKVDSDSQKKATQTTETKKQTVPSKLQPKEKKEQTKSKAPVALPVETPDKQDKSAVQIESIQPQQMEPLSASAFDEKGRQIKWQILCTGSACGNNNVLKGFVIQDYLVLCGSVGQTAVGPGSSPSFGVNSGYWQETLYGFLRGDANRDGIINLGDVIFLLNYLFKGGSEPNPYALGDANSDATIELGDVIYLLNYLFKGGPEPSC